MTKSTSAAGKTPLDTNNLSEINKDIKDDDQNATEEFRLALSVLPEMNQRKRCLDGHLAMSAAILHKVKTCHWERCFDLESSVEDSQEHSEIVIALKAFLKDEEVPREDRLRSLMWFISRNPRFNTASVLGEDGVFADKDAALKFFLSNNNIASPVPPPTSPLLQPHDKSSARQQQWGVWSTAVKGVLGNLLSGLNIANGQDMANHAQRRLMAVLDGALARLGLLAPTQNYEETTHLSRQFTLHSPSDAQGGKHAEKVGSGPTAYSHVIVFVVGGVTYEEWWVAKEHLSKRLPHLNAHSTKGSIVVGGSEVIDGKSLLRAISRLPSAD